MNLMNSRLDNLQIFCAFNIVRKQDEKINSLFCPSTAFAFNNLIHDSRLFDMKMGDRRFTYLCDEGFKLSKLDRMAVSPTLCPTSLQPLSLLYHMSIQIIRQLFYKPTL